jgi:hypothetical protein
MQKIKFDSGVQEFEINGKGVLRFNPSDPNVYRRFFEARDHIAQYAKEYEENAVKAQVAEQAPDTDNAIRTAAEIAFREMAAIDKKVKAELTYVFGEGNDFEEILGGVSLLAVTKNGEYVITNLFTAFLPIIEQGAKDQAAAKLNEIGLNRAARRAMTKAQGKKV